MAKLGIASQDQKSYDQYAGVLDVASQTVGKITHGLQGIKLSQIEVNIPSDPTLVQTDRPPHTQLVQIQSENTLNSEVEYLEMFQEAVQRVEPLVIPADLII